MSEVLPCAASSERRGSFEEFAADFSRELRRLCWALTGDKNLGEDLAQVTLMKVWRAWPRIDGDPVAYAKKTAVNQSISWKRRRAWHGEVPTDEIVEASGRDQLYLVRPGGEAADNAAARIDVERLLGTLNAKDRAVVVARFLLDMGVDETAALLGCSPGTVKSRTSRALSKIRDQLQVTAAASDPRPREE